MSTVKLEGRAVRGPIHLRSLGVFAGARARPWLVVGLTMLGSVAGPAGAQPPTDPPLQADDARLHWRQVGVKQQFQQTCPAPGHPWTVEPLFDMAVSPDLEDFCLYEHVGPVATPQDVDRLRSLGLVELEPDAMALAPQGLGLQGQLWSDLRTAVHHHGGRFSGAAVPVSGQAAARLVLVDTSPDPGMNTTGLPERSPHGHGLRELAAELVCEGSTSCAVEVSSRLAMAYVAFDPFVPSLSVRDDVRGGHVGTLADLARAVHRELRWWLASGGSRPLVLNLSLGWDGALFGGLEPHPALMPPTPRAVYRVLDLAACLGVTTVAAAGNLPDHRDPAPGPLLPAAWETRGRSCGGAGYRPLVHAAAAVDGLGEPLVTARAVAPLVAYGDHAVVEEGSGGSGVPTATLTGSSVAALVVSATAAAVRHHFPGLGSGAAMDEVYRAADVLAATPDFVYPGGGSPARTQARRVSVCGVLGGVCAWLGGCPALPACAAWSPSPVAPAAITGSATKPPYDATAVTAASPPAAVCGGDDPLYDPLQGVPCDPCPQRQYHGAAAAPWLHPQPGSDPCPNCLYESGAQSLHLEIDGSYAASVAAPTLLACGQAHNLDGVGTLRAGESATVTGLDLGGCDKVALSFAASDGSSTLSSVLVVP